MAWHGSIHYSEEGGKGQDNIQHWEDEVGKKPAVKNPRSPRNKKKVREGMGVSMNEMEYKYYVDQKTERKMFYSLGAEHLPFCLLVLVLLVFHITHAEVIVSNSSDEAERFDESPNTAIIRAETTSSKQRCDNCMWISIKVQKKTNPLPCE